MNQMFTIWRSLGTKRQLIVAAATIAVFAAILGVSGTFSPVKMTLLYSGLDATRSGEVLQALEQRGVTYNIRGNSILVPEAQRDELRMSLAVEGLPSNSGTGYELLDTMSGFGTTSQMFDAAYWRAKEGELARTISAAVGIRSARVHIAAPTAQVFRRDVAPTASVTILTTGSKVTPNQAKAIRFMVSSAVTSMSPEDVSVIDGNSQLVVGDDSENNRGADREATLRQNIERLLAARVGSGNAIVELTIETVNQTESVTERRIDPETRIAISSDTEEKTDSSDSSDRGNVTVASNLPEGNGASGDRSKSETSETRERINYEVSETTREIHRGAGDTRRLSVAVLVNGVKSTSGTGEEVWQSRSADELADLRELVSSAVGFDPERGDVITIRSLPFEQIEETGTLIEQSAEGVPLDWMQLAQVAALAVVALVLGLFVVKPIILAQIGRDPALLDDSTPMANQAASEPGELAPLSIASAPGFGNGDEPFTAMGVGDFGGMLGSDDSDPVSRLKRLIGERREETVEVLRSWMDEREGTA